MQDTYRTLDFKLQTKKLPNYQMVIFMVLPSPAFFVV